jgi:hypothetical protein
MKKNIIIAVLAIIAAAGVESTVFFHHQANKLHKQNIQLAKYLSEVREESKSETAKYARFERIDPYRSFTCKQLLPLQK